MNKMQGNLVHLRVSRHPQIDKNTYLRFARFVFLSFTAVRGIKYDEFPFALTIASSSILQPFFKSDAQ